MARIHRHECHLRQVGAHGIGVVRRHARRPQLLQQQRLQVHQVIERAGHVHQRLAGADPAALFVAQVDPEANAALDGHTLQPGDRKARRRDHRAPQEQGVGNLLVAEAADHVPGPVEVEIGPVRDVALFERPRRAGPVLAVATLGRVFRDGACRRFGAFVGHGLVRRRVSASQPYRHRRPAQEASATRCGPVASASRSSLRCSAMRNASSSAWLALSRGSQCV